MAQHSSRDYASTGHVSTDMPHPADQPMPQLAAEHKAKVIGRHQRTDPETIHGVSQTQGQVGTEQA